MNTNLANAKNAKNDEFYTQYADIQKEINAYLEYNPDLFRGKTVLLHTLLLMVLTLFSLDFLLECK